MTVGGLTCRCAGGTHTVRMAPFPEQETPLQVHTGVAASHPVRFLPLANSCQLRMAAFWASSACTAAEAGRGAAGWVKRRPQVLFAFS